MYAICFDFPESEGAPWFAALLDDGLGLTSSLENALRWDDETAAINTLRSGYGEKTRAFGAVVELSR